MQVGGAEGGHPSAEQTDDQEDDGGDSNGAQRDNKVDVTFSRGVFVKRSVEWQRADGGGQSIGEKYPQNPTRKCQNESFRHELHLNVPAPCSQRAPQADLTDALIDGHQHDVHQADAADSQSQCSHKGEERLKADGDAINDGAELLAAEHLDGALVGG